MAVRRTLNIEKRERERELGDCSECMKHQMILMTEGNGVHLEARLEHLLDSQ